MQNKQRRGKAIENFADRIKKINGKFFAVTENEDANKVLRALDTFTRGLAGEIGELTKLKFPKTLQEAIATATAIESIDIELTGAVGGTLCKVEPVMENGIKCYGCGKKRSFV